MRLLLDTHAFLWFFTGNTSLSARARALIEDESNEKLFSVASLWEIAHQGEYRKAYFVGSV